MVEGPNGYMRYSPVGRTADPARQIVAPYDGSYTVTVLPALVMQSGGDVGPSGNADWSYVGSLEQLDAPTATDVDLTAANMTGTYDVLTDNLFNVTGFSAGDIITVTVDSSGGDAEGVLQVWSSATMLDVEIAIDEDDELQLVVPQSGSLLLLVDWMENDGPAVSFEMSGAAKANFENLGILGDDSTTSSTAVDVAEDTSFSYSFSVSAGQVIELVFDNAEEEEVELLLHDATGAELLDETYVDAISATDDTDYNYWYSENGGTYTIEITPEGDSGDLTDVVATINTMTPNDLGTVATGDTVTASVTDALDENRSGFHIFTSNDPIVVEGDLTTAGDEDADAYFYDSSYDEIDAFTSGGSVTIEETILPAAGSYLVRVEAEEDVPSYDLNMTFSEAPQLEQEPNDTDATATPFDITKAMRGSTSGTGEIDIFSFSIASDLAADEVFIVDLAQFSDEGDEYICTLRDSTGADVGTVSPNGIERGCMTMSMGLLASETYYLEIERDFGSDDEDYQINTRIETGVLEVEPNEDETAATSFDLDLLIGGTELFGDVTIDTDVDYFSFTLGSDRPTDEVVTFSAQQIGPNPTTSTEWRLLDGNLTEIATGGFAGDLTATGLTQGTYYLELTRTSSTTYFSGTYQVSAMSEVPVCGNSTVETGELCDDGNITDGDGCSSTCQIEGSATNNTSGPLNSSSTTLTRVATVSGCTTPVSGINIDVDISHAYVGDIALDLTSPDGTNVVLKSGSFTTGTDLVGNYPNTLTPEGSLSDFNGDVGNGDWELFIEDTYPSFDDGTFNSFTVNLTCD
jgi:cysteine-rich repeat protein